MDLGGVWGAGVGAVVVYIPEIMFKKRELVFSTYNAYWIPKSKSVSRPKGKFLPRTESLANSYRIFNGYKLIEPSCLNKLLQIKTKFLLDCAQGALIPSAIIWSPLSQAVGHYVASSLTKMCFYAQLTTNS
jgi:hypothetical protein